MRKHDKFYLPVCMRKRHDKFYLPVCMRKMHEKFFLGKETCHVRNLPAWRIACQGNWYDKCMVLASQLSFGRPFIDFRRTLEKDGFWAAVYYIDGLILDCLLILWWLVKIFHYSILGGLNWRNNYCTKYTHYLLMSPISWIIDIDSASVSSTHTVLVQYW